MDASDIFSAVELLNSATTQSELHTISLNMAASCGVEFAFAGIIPPVGLLPKQQLDHVLLGRWPEEWVARYFSRGYLDEDPTIDHVRNNLTPVFWRNLSEQPSIIMNEARQFKLNDGFTVPMLSLDGICIGMSFAGDRLSLHPETSITLNMTSALVCARSLEIFNNKKKYGASPKLTKTELRCVKWIIEGKTNWEISKIIGNSEKTVETHVSKILRKFGALNRSQITAQAIRLGIFK